MKKYSLKYNRSVVIYTVILTGLVFSTISMYADIESTTKLNKDVKSNLLMLDYLDKLNTAITLIERNEKPYLIASNAKVTDEILGGYLIANEVLDSLKKPINLKFFNENEIILLDSFLNEKIKLSSSLIFLSKNNHPDSAISILNGSKDKEIVFGFIGQYNFVYKGIKDRLHKLQDDHISQARTLYLLLISLLTCVFCFIVYTLHRLNNQIKLKNKLIQQNIVYSDMINKNISDLEKSQEQVVRLADSLEKTNKVLEQDLIVQTAIIKDVFKRIKDVIIGTDQYYNIIYASGHVNSIFGLDENQLEGKSFEKLFDEISLCAKSKLPKITNEEQRVWNFEFLHLRTLKWFEVNIYTSEQGSSIYFSDKTESKKNLEEIIKSKEIYEFISKANEITLHAKTPDELYSKICEMAVGFDDIIFSWVGKVNDESKKLIPLCSAGKGQGYLDVVKIISTANQPEGEGPAGRAYREGNYCYSNDIENDPTMAVWKNEGLKRGFRSCIALPLKTNEIVVAIFVLYTSKPFYFTDEQIELLVNVSENINFALQAFYIVEQKKGVERELKKVLKAIEQSHASIVITDDRGNIEYVNPAFSKLTGYSFEEAIGQNPRILKSGHTSEGEYEDLWGKITHNTEWSGELCNKKKNGELYWEYAVISPVLNSKGEVSNYIAVKENITEKKILAVEQKKITQDLLKRNRDLEQFSYILSHNIRSPLSNILGLKEILLKRIPTGGDEHMLLEGISESADSLDRVIKDLSQVLNLKKVSMDEKENIFFDQLIYSIREDNNLIILKKGAHITRDFTKATNCYSISSYLKSIFYNLIINALKFSKPQQSPEIKIWSEIENDLIKIHFKDNGIGIDLNRYGDSIFGLYKRFNLNIEGKGLGLFMVKTQIEFLGGQIEVKSKINEWTEFIISLPNEIKL